MMRDSRSFRRSTSLVNIMTKLVFVPVMTFFSPLLSATRRDGLIFPQEHLTLGASTMRFVLTISNITWRFDDALRFPQNHLPAKHNVVIACCVQKASSNIEIMCAKESQAARMRSYRLRRRLRKPQNARSGAHSKRSTAASEVSSRKRQSTCSYWRRRYCGPHTRRGDSSVRGFHSCRSVAFSFNQEATSSLIRS